MENGDSKKAPSVLLFIESSREFGRGLLHGIARYSRLHGPWRVYRRSAGLESAFPEWRDLKIDGALVRDVKMVQNLTGAGIPVIFAQHKRATTSPFPVIITDSAAIGQMAAEHFLDRGFVHFAYCGLDEFVWSRLRAQYFSERLKAAGFETSLYRQPRRVAERAWKSEQYLIADWLVSLPKPVALMCCNDDRALQVIEACKLAELHVPDQVAVLGVDNDVLICDLADPPISSVALNTEVAGHDAAKLLDHLMKGGRMTGQTIPVRPTHIVTRMSTDILAVTDPAVAPPCASSGTMPIRWFRSMMWSRPPASRGGSWRSVSKPSCGVRSIRRSAGSVSVTSCSSSSAPTCASGKSRPRPVSTASSTSPGTSATRPASASREYRKRHAPG